MKNRYIGSLLIVVFIQCFGISVIAQPNGHPEFSLADTLRGSVTPERSWWDVLHYDLSFSPDYNAKTISGKNTITYKVISSRYSPVMQIDLKEPLIIDSIVQDGKQLGFRKVNSVWHATTEKQQMGNVKKLTVYYHGKVHEAVRPPWEGGFTFTTDSLNRPWMTVTCQGEAGASIWYPCKDHQSDEPDNGASLTIIIPDTLVGIANGRLLEKKEMANNTTAWKWGVVSPISTYCIIPYIGKYVNFAETYMGEKGDLDINYWVLDYNLQKAKAYMPDQVQKMFKAFEHWFGPYPFYEDGYKLIETSNTGMEHQSAVSYGNGYEFGYRKRDISYSGWGLKFDFIIIHESGHEWFGNNITSKDLADMWVHEGFTNYSETLFADYLFGEKAGNEYNFGSRKGIQNDKPIIPAYNVNAKGSGDMYPKAGNMLHSIRHSINDDEKFRMILRGLNKTFYHQVVNTQQIERYVSEKAAFNFQKVYDQYLRTTQLPVFEFYFNENMDKVFYRYVNCVTGFNLPLALVQDKLAMKIFPGQEWKSSSLSGDEAILFDAAKIEKMYYLKVNQVKKN